MNLMDPGQIGQNAMAAFFEGRTRRREMETDRALGQYAADPSSKNAMAVTQHNPGYGLRLQEYEMEREKQARKESQELRVTQLQQAAAGGDKAALAELAGIDLDAWAKIGNVEKQALEQRVDFIGQAALAVSQLPEANRPTAWDSYIQRGSQMFPDLAQYAGQYSPETLNSAIAMAGQVKSFLELERPSYQVIPEGGTLVDTRNPEAIQQFQGARGPGPQPGVVVDGYRFIGGNPNDRNSWQQVEGGAGGNASGTFPG